jgi:predicted nucleic acid-binding protein
LIRASPTARPKAVKTYETGATLADHYRLSVHDAMIAAPAHHARRDTLWSENMLDSILIQDRLRIAKGLLTNNRVYRVGFGAMV